jgi:DHA1 family tetracycline resistance protein-like MFS transporter
MSQPAADAAGQAPRKHGRNAFFFIIVTVFIDMVAFAVIMPSMPSLLMDLTGLAKEDVAPWGGYITTVYAVVNFLAQPILGNLSDRFGRRPILLASMGTLGIDFVIMGAAHSIWLLFIGRFLSGLSGATHSTAAAYIADTTEPEQRGQAFGMLGAAFGLGFILGPAIGGFLGQFDPRWPFFASGGLAVINFCYGLFVLPESLDKAHRRAFDWKRANAFGAFRHFAKLPHLAWFMAALCLYNFAHWVYPSTFNYFGAVRYGWDPGMLGLSLTAVGLGSALVQGLLVGRSIKRFGATQVAVFGFVTAIIAFSAYSFASQGWMVFAIIPFSAMAGVLAPALNQIMSARVAANAQGELQGAIASVQAIANVFSPLVMTQTFNYFTHPPFHFAGAAFLLAAIMATLSLIPLSKGLRSTPKLEGTGGPPPPEPGDVAPSGDISTVPAA